MVAISGNDLLLVYTANDLLYDPSHGAGLARLGKLILHEGQRSVFWVFNRKGKGHLIDAVGSCIIRLLQAQRFFIWVFRRCAVSEYFRFEGKNVYARNS